MNAPQGTARRERAHVDRRSPFVPDAEHRDRIAHSAADHVARRIEELTGLNMTDEAWNAYVAAIVPQLDALMATVALPPVGYHGEIGGDVEREAA